MIIGAQLYTVRDFCKTAEDLAETLKKIRDIGYTEVQLSGVCDYEADWMAEQLKKNDLSARITHFNYQKIVNKTEETIAFHKAMGASYIGLGSIPDYKKKGCERALYENFLREIAPVTEKIATSGLKFMYHNHNMEFVRVDGKNLLEEMCEAFPDKDRFGITLDTYWVTAGGADPVEWLYRLAGRTDCVHFKDMNMKFDPETKSMVPKMVPLGEGNMNYDAIFEACEKTGVKVGYVEQDRCNGEDPFDCMRRSYAFMHSFGMN